MIVTEVISIQSAKTRSASHFIKTYSDDGHYIVRDGIQYIEAIDPEDSGRVYTESEELIPVPEEETISKEEV